MSLTPSSVKRAVDSTGDEIKTLETAGGEQVQAVGIIDENEAHVGTSSNPMPVSGSLTIASLPEYGTNNLEEASATITYIAKEKADGAWLIMKIDTSSGTAIRYATITNNPTVATYAEAWAARATTLIYGTYGEAL